MDIPEFNYNELPKEMQEKVSEDFEIEPLQSQDDYKYEPKPGHDEYLNRKMIKTLDEYITLQKIHKNKESTKQEKWKKVKQASRYYKSNLYAVKNLDRDPRTAYDNVVFDSDTEEDS